MAEKVQFHDRRYIGTKETIAYCLFDSSKSVNISAYSGRFNLDLVKIDFGWGAVAGVIGGVWDIINDTFSGLLVDKTQTRWGKFKPYLLAFAIPGTIFGILGWLTPYFFDRNPKNIKKLIYSMTLGMTGELMGTFRSFAETGFISSISPNPQDKVLLFTVAEVISGLWESFPSIFMGLLIDLINHNKIAMSMESAYLSMGTFCAVYGGIAALIYFSVAKERIAQSIEKPSFRDGLKTILNNRPMMIMMLSDLMNTFKFDTGTQNYFADVLGTVSLQNIIVIPGAPLSILSYTYLPWAQKKFSTKALWIFGDMQKDITNLLIFIIGSIGGKGKGGLYHKVFIMGAAYIFKDIIYKSTLSVYKIIPKMMMTEALDYCEWKNGYRTEGTTLAVKGLIQKIAGVAIGPLRNIIMIKIGYSLKAGFGKQTDRTKYLLFACCTLLPGLTGLLSNIPKFFYKGSLETRDRMYAELAQMRAVKRRAIQEREDELQKNNDQLN